MPRQVYRLRVLGLALGFLCVAAVFCDRGASPIAWAALTAHAFLWPHVAWYRARVSADPNRTERVNLIVDSALGGVWVALMEFSLLPSVLLITMLSMDKLGWGARPGSHRCDVRMRAQSLQDGPACGLAPLVRDLLSRAGYS